MLPSPRSLAAFGLRSALNDLVAAEDRAHAFLDAYDAPPRERAAVAAALRALDRIDVGAHELTAALRRLEDSQMGADAGSAVVTLREREGPRASPAPVRVQH